MDILGILFILWAIVTIFEVVIISGMKVSTFKYNVFSYQNNFPKITLFLNTSMV